MQTTTTTDIFRLGDEVRSKQTHLEANLAKAREEEASAERAFETSPSPETHAAAAVARQLTKNAAAELVRHIESSREVLEQEARAKALAKVAELEPVADWQASTAEILGQIASRLPEFREWFKGAVTQLDARLVAAFKAGEEIKRLREGVLGLGPQEAVNRQQLNQLLTPLSQRLAAAAKKAGGFEPMDNQSGFITVFATPFTQHGPTFKVEFNSQYGVAK